MADESKFDLDLSAGTEERVVIGKVKLSDDPERIVDIYSPDTKYYVKLLKFQRKLRRLLPIIQKQDKGELDPESLAPEDLDAAFTVGDDIMALLRPLMPDVKDDEEIEILPEKAGQLLQWVTQKSAAQAQPAQPAEGQEEDDAEKKTKTKAITSPTA